MRQGHFTILLKKAIQKPVLFIFLLAFMLSLLPASLFGQTIYMFEQAMPGSSITYKMKSEFSMEINRKSLNADTTMPPSQPVLFKTNTENTLTADYGSPKPDETYPATFLLKTPVLKSTVNGMEIPNRHPEIQNDAKLTGVVDKHFIFHLTEADCGDVSEDLKKLIIPDAQNTIQELSFPATKLNIGDSTAKSMSLKIPVPGLGTAIVKNTTIYKLKKVTGSTAIFDVSYKFENQSDLDSCTIDLSGIGIGTLAYDYKTLYTKEKSDDITVIAKIKTKMVTFDLKYHTVTTLDGTLAKKKNTKKNSK